MAHHAYAYAGQEEEGIANARGFAARELGLDPMGPDVTVFPFGLFSVDDARRVGEFAAQAPLAGDQKCIVISTGRLFHEAQNALLKLFEEPPVGTTMILIVPAFGILLPTLRSRLMTLPGTEGEAVVPADMASEFRSLDSAGREKCVTKLLARTKSDKETDKQAARREALELIEGLIRAAYAAREKAKPVEKAELDRFLYELDRFVPLMHERSAPLKLIFEHILLVLPRMLSK